MNSNIFKKFNKGLNKQKSSSKIQDTSMKIDEENLQQKIETVGKLLQFKLKSKDTLSDKDIAFRDMYHNELEQYTLQQLIDLQKDLKKQ
jgi:hypothetical protein